VPSTAVVNPTVITPASLPTTTSLADAALSYAAMGWCVFPLAPRSKEPLRGSHGYKDATFDLTTVQQWWREHPDANIGLATTNLAVLDVDPRNGGDSTLDDLEAQYGRLPHTVESHTGSGGRHLFFLRPEADIRIGTHALGPGLDIKSGGPYVVLPPSIHPNGQAYEWEASSEPGMVDVAPMPAWMVELLTQPIDRTACTKSSTSLGTTDTLRVSATSTRSELDLALARLLGIDYPVGSKFLCLLHAEKHPSAWLFWGKGGDLLYHCEHFGGYTLNIPSLFVSVREGRIVRLKGEQHNLERLLALYAAGLIEVPPILYMPLPEDTPPEAKAWYDGFIFTVALKQIAHPGSRGTAFSRRFAMRMTGLSERDEQAAAKWLLGDGYVRATGFYKAYGKLCKLLSLGPGPSFNLLDEEEEVIDEAA
jgi:hypothetical protein